jgi:hypothetical protein
MSICEQSSQRTTWPPRAAVRQLSIALITFIWPSLVRPLANGVLKTIAEAFGWRHRAA